MTTTQPVPPHFDGPNGRYSLCTDCGRRYGAAAKSTMGMWRGTCDICGESGWLSNAYHDWSITDEHIDGILALRDGA